MSDLKLFCRFLKDSGIYSIAKPIYIETIKEYKGYENCKTFKDLLTTASPIGWISYNRIFCCWAETEQGDEFWRFFNYLWLFVYYKDKKEPSDMLKDSLKNCYKKINQHKINERFLDIMKNAYAKFYE